MKSPFTTEQRIFIAVNLQEPFTWSAITDISNDVEQTGFLLEQNGLRTFVQSDKKETKQTIQFLEEMKDGADKWEILQNQSLNSPDLYDYIKTSLDHSEIASKNGVYGGDMPEIPHTNLIVTLEDKAAIANAEIKFRELKMGVEGISKIELARANSVPTSKTLSDFFISIKADVFKLVDKSKQLTLSTFGNKTVNHALPKPKEPQMKR